MTQSQALAILKTGRNVFLTGEPGSGKTYTINRYVDYLRSCQIEPAITASTGIAATHIGGMTIHSWSGIGISKKLSSDELREISQRDRLVDRIIGTSVLIIDEISMLDGQTVGLVDLVCRTVRKSDKPFGGIQIVFVGDFFQLPPVSREGDPSPQFAFASDVWAATDPVTCYLSEHHRQEDEVFLEVLRALRRGEITTDHQAVLLERQLTVTKEQIGADVPKLFPHNLNVDELNQRELKKLADESFVFTMTSQGPKALVEQLKRGCLSPEELVLKKGARVMFTKNSIDGQFVNGTLGIIVRFDEETGQPIVRTRNGRMISVSAAPWSIQAEGKILASISQLPLRLAWAMTVHKSQGMSLDAAYVDLSQAFVPGQGYVALSRVRSLEGLHLGGLNDRALRVHSKVQLQDQIFHQQSERAVEELQMTSSVDLTNQQEEFIRVCGGSIPQKGRRAKAPKPATDRKQQRYEQTIALIRSGMSLEDVAKERGRKIGTIIEHLEEVRKLNQLALADIAHLQTGPITDINEIFAAFSKLGMEHIKPVYSHFDGRFSYETLRLARLFYPAP